MNETRLTPARKWTATAAVVILCCVPFFRSYEIRDRPLGEDEIYWIGQAYYFHLAFEERDWSNPDWQLLPASENPALGKYVIGVGLRLDGLSVTTPDWLGVFYVIARDRPNAWGEGIARQERQAVVDRMDASTRELALKQNRFEYPVEYATTARAIMLVFGAISIVSVFGLASLYMNLAPAFLAALLFSLHPAVVAAYTQVGVDILAIAFSLLAVIYFVLIERRVWQGNSHPRLCRGLICVGGGLSLALAVGSKINAVTVGFLGSTMCLQFIASFLRHKSEEANDSLKAMIVLIVISLVIFVGSNPGNFPNPLKGIHALYANQQRSLEIQKNIPAIRQPLRSLKERLQAVTDLTAFNPIVFLLVGSAFFFQIFAACKSGKPFPVIALWWLITIVAVTAWIPFARARYALPVIAPSIILICVGIERLYQTGVSKVAARNKIS
jgi:hypothetical protein